MDLNVTSNEKCVAALFTYYSHSIDILIFVLKLNHTSFSDPVKCQEQKMVKYQIYRYENNPTAKQIHRSNQEK